MLEYPAQCIYISWEAAVLIHYIELSSSADKPKSKLLWTRLKIKPSLILLSLKVYSPSLQEDKLEDSS